MYAFSLLVIKSLIQIDGLFKLLHALVVLFLLKNAVVVLLLEVTVLILGLVKVLNTFGHILLGNLLDVLQIVQQDFLLLLLAIGLLVSLVDFIQVVLLLVE